MAKSKGKSLLTIAAESGVSVGRLRRAAETLRFDTSRGTTFTALDAKRLIAQAEKTSKFANKAK